MASTQNAYAATFPNVSRLASQHLHHGSHHAALPEAIPLPPDEKDIALRLLRELCTLVFAEDQMNLVQKARENGMNADAFKTSYLRGLNAGDICGNASCIAAVTQILTHEFAIDKDEWTRHVFEDGSLTEKIFGLGVKIDPQETRDPFAMVLQTKMGRGVFEPERLTEQEVLRELQTMMADWHDLCIDAFPWIGKLLVNLSQSELCGDLDKALDWLNHQGAKKFAYSESANNYVLGEGGSEIKLRDQIRRFVLVMYVYEKMSLRSLLDPHFLAALHRYYEGVLEEAQQGMTKAEAMHRKALFAKGAFGNFFMQLKQASVSVTFPGLSAMKNGEDVAPGTAAGLLGILSVNIFEAVMGELLIKGRLGNGVCGVALIGTESQKDVRYVSKVSETPHLVSDATYHKAVLFGEGNCPDDLVHTKVYPVCIPLDAEYLNAYTSWNALFTTTMSDFHIVFAKLLYPRMLRALIHDPGQWGDQRPWTLYMAVSAFWVRTEKHMDFVAPVDFLAAAPKNKLEVLKRNCDHLTHKARWQVGKLYDKVRSSLRGSRDAPADLDRIHSDSSSDEELDDVGDLGRACASFFHGIDDLLPEGSAACADAEGSCDEAASDSGSDVSDAEVSQHLSFVEEGITVTRLAQECKAGDLQLNVMSKEGFCADAPVIIGTETNMMKNVDSMSLATPIAQDWPVGTIVAVAQANLDDSEGDEEDASPPNAIPDDSPTDIVHAVKERGEMFLSRRIDRWTRDRWIAALYKPMLPEYPDLIQFWTEMNHRYGDRLMQKYRHYNFSRRFRKNYDRVSIKARKAECISNLPSHRRLPINEKRAPKAAVPSHATRFIVKEITRTGGRTHDYLEEFYGKRNEEMAQLMKSSIYPGSGNMDMVAMISKTNTWKGKHKLP